ncbi:putative membrane protein SirB2 [Lysobacter niastensis]|uniref:Membrane protein SirB2 n=1 Tax=Lysobacter niastensis TaxID=380629 RepID=A0ABU1W777_9GAMM|nr:SirB2 family protein [Lysobacter niastensis]MDR7133342.1 putative membrane protein SirB2 [Lysobacter niastensis]
MLEFYAQIKWAHVAAVLASGSLFLLRGLLVQLNQPRLAMAAPLRYLSYSIDTVLLTAALMLLTILPGAMFANGWLAVKLSLLVVYVGLGTFALKRGQTVQTRRTCYVLALLVFAFMTTVARAHHPLGAVWLWLA